MSKYFLVTHSRSRLYPFDLFQVIYVIIFGNTVLLGTWIFNSDSAENNYGCFIFRKLWFVSKDNGNSVI